MEGPLGLKEHQKEMKLKSWPGQGGYKGVAAYPRQFGAFPIFYAPN